KTYPSAVGAQLSVTVGSHPPQASSCDPAQTKAAPSRTCGGDGSLVHPTGRLDGGASVDVGTILERGPGPLVEVSARRPRDATARTTTALNSSVLRRLSNLVGLSLVAPQALIPQHSNDSRMTPRVPEEHDEPRKGAITLSINASSRKASSRVSEP